jgi:TBC1 domain family protein 5
MIDKRNIPEMAASLVSTPTTSPAPSVLPLTDERNPEERPPWEPRTRLEMEREIASLRDTSKRLGSAVGWIVDVLLQDESVASGPQDVESIHRRKREALECLSYVRDVLLTNPKEIDGSRLVGEEELKSRRSREVAAKSHEVPQMVLHRPSSVPVAEPRSRPTSSSALPPLALDAARRQRPSASPGQQPSYLPSASSSNAPSISFAPWKHTKSDFTGESFSRATLPRPPPPISGNFIRHSTQSVVETPLRKSDDRPDSNRSNTNDPLGVLDSDP